MIHVKYLCRQMVLLGVVIFVHYRPNIMRASLCFKCCVVSIYNYVFGEYPAPDVVSLQLTY